MMYNLVYPRASWNIELDTFFTPGDVGKRAVPHQASCLSDTGITPTWYGNINLIPTSHNSRASNFNLLTETP